MLSRHIESNLDRETEDFELEVSSAGITHPLVLLRQYLKNIGRIVSVTYKDGKVVNGVLKSAGADSFVVTETKIIKKPKSTEEIDHEIFYNQIKETKIVIKFNS
jgi:ribosome maturation factor RimP